MSNTFVSNPNDVVRQKDKVWVKVIGIMDDRIRLSMKDVDQRTGRAKG